MREGKRQYYYKSKLALVRDAALEDVYMLAQNLRKEDRIEIWYSHHVTPVDALLEGFRNSIICLTIERDEQPIAIFGVTSPQTLLSETGIVWLLISEEINEVQKSFLRNARRFIDLFFDYFPRLENYVYSESKKTIRWLNYIGATIEEPLPYGAERKLFRHFYFEKARKWSELYA